MKKRKTPLLLVILGDVLLGALILAVFFASKFAFQGESVKISSPAVTAQPADNSPEPEKEAGENEQLTDWQIKFKDKFSPEIIKTENSYKSPNVSIEIETVNAIIDDKPVVYHVADIYIASVENFQAYTPNGEMKFYSTADVLEMDREADALLSMSGDFYSYQGQCFIVRNGQLYKDDAVSCDICVLYSDGSMEMLRAGEYSNEDVLAREPLQIWNFGPSLLDENGEPYMEYETNYNVSRVNPRSALGYYEPGHYCFVVVDGRQNKYSVGMDLPQLAGVFRDLGCVSAYNLDGGGSAVLCFDHERYSKQSNGGDRLLGDILLIKESEGLK